MPSRACRGCLGLLAVALLSSVALSARPPATSRPPKPEGLYHAPRGDAVRQIDLREVPELDSAQDIGRQVRTLAELVSKAAPVPAPGPSDNALSPSGSANSNGSSSGRMGYAFTLPSDRDDLLRQAGTLGGIVNPGSNQTVFQATVPDNALRAGLAQIPRGQTISVDPSPPELVLQFDGNSIADSVATVALPVQPPNPAICVGNGFVVEVTNLALSVYSAENGTRLGGPVGLPAFFGVVGPPTNGLSDPYCIYDAADSKRFFVTISYFTCRTLRPDCSGKPIFNYLLIASSRTSNPLDGFQGPFYVDTSGLEPVTLQPYPGFETCKQSGVASPGCFGDYPTVGMDKNALWVGINIFTRVPLRAASLFVGSLVFGVRKFDLVAGGRVFPPYAAYHNWGNIPGFTIVPSKTESGANTHSAANNGSVFLVSSDLFTFSGLVNYMDGIPALRTWAITQTDRIGQGFPDDLLPVVSDPVVLLTEELQYPTVEFYDYDDQTAVITQPAGRSLDARDERLRQVSYADGLLWTSLVTAVSVAGLSVDAAAYFVIDPSFSAAGVYTPSLINQGYVSVFGNSIVDPSITATADRTGVMTGSVVGTGYHLSPFFATVSLTEGVGVVQIPHLSTSELLAEDYLPLTAAIRTGDYSTACLDENGTVWLVAEYAAAKNASARSGSGSNSDIVLNWGTWIMNVEPL